MFGFNIWKKCNYTFYSTEQNFVTGGVDQDTKVTDNIIQST